MPDLLRIVSLSPSATEIVCALGLESALMGISHRCDFPVTVAQLPRVTESLLPTISAEQPEDLAEDEEALPPTAQELYELVSAAREAGALPFRVNVDLLRELQPTVVLMEHVSRFSAVDDSTVEAIRQVTGEATVITLDPRTLADALAAFRQVGVVTGREVEAEALVASVQNRWDAVAQTVAGATERPRTLLLEWPEPLLAAGRWMPELLTLAGAMPAAWSSPGMMPRVLEGADVQAFAPETVVLVADGLDAYQALEEAYPLTDVSGWYTLPAVQNGDCYTVNGNAYLTRFGPRLAESAEILATILHPDVFTEMLPPFSVQIFGSDLLQPEEQAIVTDHQG